MEFWVKSEEKIDQIFFSKILLEFLWEKNYLDIINPLFLSRFPVE